MNFLSSICLSAVATALFRMLVPENKFSKQLSVLIVCVFILTGITALSGARLDFDEIPEISKTADYIRFSGEVSEELKRRVCSEAEEKIRALLAENEIYPEEVHIIVNISGLYSINITEVRIVQKKGENDEKAFEILRRELPSGVRVTFSTKNGEENEN